MTASPASPGLKAPESQNIEDDEQLRRPTFTERFRAMFSTSASPENEAKRAMKSRHLMMIGRLLEAILVVADAMYHDVVAIGGTIGTGIFLSAGSVSKL